MNTSKKTGFKNRTALWLILTIFFSSTAFAENIIIICNKKVAETVLDKDGVIKIFMGKKTEWQDHQKIKFVIMKKGSIHKEFLKQYIGKSSSQFRNYWRKKVFTGKGRAPKKIDSPEAMIQYVAETNGAIGYIPEGSLSADVKKLSE